MSENASHIDNAVEILCRIPFPDAYIGSPTINDGQKTLLPLIVEAGFLKSTQNEQGDVQYALTWKGLQLKSFFAEFKATDLIPHKAKISDLDFIQHPFAHLFYLFG